MRMVDNIKAFYIERRLRKQRKRLSTSNVSEVKRLIKKINWRVLNEVQKYKLCRSLKYATENSSYYREKLSKITTKLSLNNASSTIEKMPFTTPAELSKNPERFLAIPESEVAAFHFSAGTMGKSKKLYVSKKDLAFILFSYSLGLIKSGVNSTDIAQIMFSFGLWQVGMLYREALKRLGIKCLPTGNFISFQEQQEFIEEFGTTVIGGTPSYIYNFAREADLPTTNKEKMKAIFLGGEGLSQKRRRTIEEQLGGEIFMGYGLMEFGGAISAECEYHRGYHLFTTTVLPEIVDIKTGEPVEKEEYGELVLTSLDREAMPLIRYRTGDVTRFIEGECDCGLKLTMIDYIKGRCDDRLTIGTAEKYYPIVFDELFDSIEEVKDYQIEIMRKNGRDVLKVHVVSSKASEDLRKEILRKFYNITTLKLDIQKTKTVNEPEITFVDKINQQQIKRRSLLDRRRESD